MFLFFPARRLRSKTTLGGQGAWQVEVGETVPNVTETGEIKENSSNVCCCQVTSCCSCISLTSRIYDFEVALLL